jgi:hypothetical protein
MQIELVDSEKEVLKSYLKNIKKEKKEDSVYIKNFCIYLARIINVKKVYKRRYYSDNNVVIIFSSEFCEKDNYHYFLKVDFENEFMFNSNNPPILYRIHKDRLKEINDTFILKGKKDKIIGTRISIFHNSLEVVPLDNVDNFIKFMPIKTSNNSMEKDVFKEDDDFNLTKVKNENWVNEDYLLLSLDEGDEILYSNLTARDRVCIDLKIPMSSKTWLNNLIEYSLKKTN